MSGIVGSRLNIRGSGVVGKLGTDGQVLTSSGAGESAVFDLDMNDTYLRLLPVHPDFDVTAKPYVLGLYIFMLLVSEVLLRKKYSGKSRTFPATQTNPAGFSARLRRFWLFSYIGYVIGPSIS